MSRRNKRNKRNYLNSILSDDSHYDDCFVREQRFIFFRRILKASFQKFFKTNRNLSSDRILPLLIRVNSWLIRGNSCSKIKISVKICEICVPLIFPLFLLFLRDQLLSVGPKKCISFDGVSCISASPTTLQQNLRRSLFCPAEIKEIKEILAAHDNLNDILRRRHFCYFFYFCGTF